MTKKPMPPFLKTHAAFLEKGLNPFYFDKVRFVQSVEESMALTREHTPHVVISASGMCEARQAGFFTICGIRYTTPKIPS